jgi:HD-GYP domain-containing protein (c-di-GMP phosphodiesterase class II)
MHSEALPETVLPQDSAFQQEAEPDAESRARAIAGKGDFAHIEHELVMEGLLKSQSARVMEKYSYIFSQMQEVNERDLEMFTILELYDKGTARHCAETYRIAREKLEKRLASGVVLGKLFEQELVTLDEFFRACLLHDIGKVDIPRSVINHPMNDTQMDLYLRDLVVEHHDPDILARLEEAGGIKPHIATAEELEAYLKEHQLRSVHFVPARMVLHEEEVEELEERGFDPDQSIMDIIKTHEARSREILTEAGMPVEGELAGMHHNYEGATSHYPLALSSLHISVDLSELLHIADVQQALSAVRSYKTGFSKPRVLRIIMEEVRRGRIAEEAAYLWVDDDLNEFRFHSDPVVSLEDAQHVQYVRSQLERIRTNLETDPERERRWGLAAA